jgi:hypothetical protein
MTSCHGIGPAALNCPGQFVPTSRSRACASSHGARLWPTAGTPRQLIAQLVVLPDTAPSSAIADRPGARHPRAVPRRSTWRTPPRAIRRAAEGMRAPVDSRWTPRASATALDALQWQAAAARARRTLVSQLERLWRVDEVDRAATTLLPPASQGWPDAELLQPSGVGRDRRHADRRTRRSRFTDARALVAYAALPGHPQAAPTRRPCRRLSLALPAIRSTSPPSMPCASGSGALPKKARQNSHRLVVIAVKLLHALYAMLKHRQPYNPSRLLVAPATIRT